MDSPLILTVFGSENVCSDALEAVFQEVARIERLFTVYRPGAPISTLNTTYEHMRPYPLDREILTIVGQALHYAKISNGAYDPSAGPAINLWGFGTKGKINTAPASEVIKTLGRTIGYPNVQINMDAGHITLVQAGMALNLGGIVKGYAIDRSSSILKDYGISKALVSFGSSLRALGSPPGKAGWRISIQHPRQEAEEITSLLLNDEALSTSGDYERYFYADGIRYSHLIDPRTGQAVSGMASVSLLAPSAMEADALSTAAFVLGEEKGLRFLEAQESLEGLLISEKPDAQLEQHYTSGWPGHSAKPIMGRRHFLVMAGVSIAAIFIPAWARGASIRFATKEEALKRMMPDAESIDLEKVELGPEQHEAAQDLIDRGFRKKDYTFFVGKKKEVPIAYAIVLNVVGKKRPITFLIGISPLGSVIGIEILIYRESKGSSVRYPRFMKQFQGKKQSDPLRLGSDIRPISGATLSSRSTAYAVKKALALFEVVYGGG